MVEYFLRYADVNLPAEWAGQLSIVKFTCLFVIGLIQVRQFVRIGVQDARTMEVSVQDMVFLIVPSVMFGVIVGFRVELFVGVAIFVASLVAVDTHKYLGMADLIIPAHILVSFASPYFGLEFLLFLCSTFMLSLAFYILFHKKITGRPWYRGCLTAALPPYCLTAVICLVFWPKLIHYV